MTKYGFEACEIIWKFLNHPTDVCHVQLKRTKTGKHGCFSKLLVFTIIPLENLLSKCTNIFQSKSAVINQRTDNFWSSSKPSKKSTKGEKKSWIKFQTEESGDIRGNHQCVWWRYTIKSFLMVLFFVPFLFRLQLHPDTVSTELSSVCDSTIIWSAEYSDSNLKMN